MADGTSAEHPPIQSGRILDQLEIDQAIGFEVQDVAPGGDARALVNAGAVPRERMPMLPVIVDDMCGRLMRGFEELFGTDVVVRVEGIVPRRYIDLLDDIVLPAQVVTFLATGWEGQAMLAMGPQLATASLETLLGARAKGAARPVSRPFSAIESAILIRIADLVLHQAEAAFAATAPVSFKRDRMASDPRLAPIAGMGDTVVAVTLRVSIDGLSGPLVLAFPLAMLEPALASLRSVYLGNRGGRGDYWANHLATEIWQSTIEAETVLHETRLPLRQVLALSVGDTLMFDMRPGDLVEVRCAGLPVSRGQIGRVDGRIAVQLVEAVERPRSPQGEGLSL